MLPTLHVVTDDRVLARPDLLDVARRLLAAGGERLALHLRGSATPAVRRYELASALRDHAHGAGALLLANDRVDLALAAGLDGVHLKARSLPAVVARGLLPEGSVVGVSVHDAGTARAASEGADYLLVGTVFATASHPGRAGEGPELVRRVGAAVALPRVAIGGVTPERVPELRAAGAHGVAVLSGIWDAPDPVAAAAGYLDRL